MAKEKVSEKEKRVTIEEFIELTKRVEKLESDMKKIKLNFGIDIVRMKDHKIEVG